jgi:hypothetical protein
MPPAKSRLPETASAIILVLLSLLLQTQAQVSNTPAPAPPVDPICGFITGPHVYSETSQIKNGLSVDIFVGQPRVNQPVTLRFFVHQKPRNMPVDQLQIEHEKFIHVIGVRDDLKEFFHLHPLRVSAGMWEASYTFPKPGNYKIWTDLKSRGVSYSLGQPKLTVLENVSQSTSVSAASETPKNLDYKVAFTHTGSLIAGRTNQFQFVIRDASGNPAEIENYLGTSMHLIIVKDDLSVYLHAHPDPRLRADSPIRFNQAFSQPGNYKLFAQFRPKNAQLPKDETILEEFELTVASGS